MTPEESIHLKIQNKLKTNPSLTKSAIRSYKMRHRRKLKGLCPECGGVTRHGRNTCADCSFKSSEDMRALYSKRKANGVCPYCETPTYGDSVMCGECLERKAIYRRTGGYA